MITYIKKNIKGYYVTFPEPLNNVELGENYKDFIQGKWVPLSEEQVQFHEENPKASVSEVFNMKINEPVKLEEPERTLHAAKEEAVRNLNTYDNSEAVNSFTINGLLKTWFTPEQRANYKNSVDSAKLLGVEILSFFVEDTLLTISTSDAEKMLAMIQLYADSCFNVTKRHILNIDALETVEEVDNYDYTTGYPDKLDFTL